MLVIGLQATTVLLPSLMAEEGRGSPESRYKVVAAELHEGG